MQTGHLEQNILPNENAVKKQCVFINAIATKKVEIESHLKNFVTMDFTICLHFDLMTN